MNDSIASTKRAAYGKAVGIVGISVNLFLSALKLVCGILSSSLAIMADAVNNLSDAASSVISFVCFKISEKPADRKHPFGHARIEYFASMIVSFIILGVGFTLFKDSVVKIISPTKTEFKVLSVVILGVAVILKLALGVFYKSVANKIDSPVARAAAADSFSDSIATFAVLVSQIVLYFSSVDLDAYLGIIVSVLIFVQGFKALNESKDLILGEAPSDEICKKIKDVIFEYPEALGIHDLTVHNYGPGKVFVSVHIEVDGQRDIFETHDVIDNIERRLCTEYGYMCTIHLDPIVTNDEEVNFTRQKVIDIVNEVAPRVSIHDFRYVKGVSHTNLIFDIVVPFEVEDANQLEAAISATIKEKMGENYYTVITVDRG